MVHDHLVATTVLWLVLVVAVCAAKIISNRNERFPRLEETYADSSAPMTPAPIPPHGPPTAASPLPMTPADYAKLIPTEFDATHPEGLTACVPPSGGAMRAVGGAYTLPNLAPPSSSTAGRATRTRPRQRSATGT